MKDGKERRRLIKEVKCGDKESKLNKADLINFNDHLIKIKNKSLLPSFIFSNTSEFTLLLTVFVSLIEKNEKAFGFYQ